MHIWRDSAEIPSDFERSVVTIGVFDGVHRGHREILARTVEEARKRGVPALALTFDPHPAEVHHPEATVHLIASLSDRLDRLESAGIDAVVVQHYTLDYAQLSPRAFAVNQLVGDMHAEVVVVGEDVRFGSGNAGDGEMLQKLGRELGFDVILVDDVRDEDAGRRFSSTWVRELLDTGDVAQAAKVLGRPHRIRGVVQHGFKRGRELGFPTANLPGTGIGEIPADGVYAGWLIQRLPDSKATVHLPAAISIGTNPTFEGVERTVEAHVLGRSDLNLYDQEVAIDFIDYVRPMAKFDSLEGLLSQMDDDLRRTAEILGVPVTGRVNASEVTAK